MRFSDWELKSHCVHGHLSFTQSHQSVYKAASPRGETVFHSDYNEREELGAGEEKENTNTVFSCVLQLVFDFMLPGGFCRKRSVILYIFTIHYTLNHRKCAAADRITLKNVSHGPENICSSVPLFPCPSLFAMCHI